MKFVMGWIALAVAVGAAVALVPGIVPMGTDSTLAIMVMALMLALVNMSVKPIAQVLSLPFTILTLGIFYVVVNALMLELASWLSMAVFGSGVSVASFGSAFFGSIVISLVSSIVNSVLGND